MSPVGSGKSNGGKPNPPKRPARPVPDDAFDKTKFFEGYLRTAADTDIPDQLIYATLMTELMVTERNRHALTPERRKAWDDAIEQFFEAVDAGVPSSDLIAEAYRFDTPPKPLTSQQRKDLAAFDEARAAGPAALDAFTERMLKRFNP